MFAADNFADFQVELGLAIQRIGETNFVERADALAEIIVKRSPDVVALQEVYDFTLNGQNSAGPFIDHLDETLKRIEARGGRYVVAAENIIGSFVFPILPHVQIHL